MTCELYALCIDAHDPLGVGRFWSGLLGWELTEDADGDVVLVPSDDTGWRVVFLRDEAPKCGPNQMHFDLTSRSLDDQRATVARALELGGRHLHIGQGPDAEHVVLADPEGNEFCVIEADNSFLAECGFIGAVASDGTQQCGYFWSNALEWPLVWDANDETAIRSPAGGPKITWGGGPVRPKTGKFRMHFDLAPTAGGDQQTEVARLVALGATHIDIGQGDVDWVVMADPDGHEFCVLAPLP